MLRLRRTMLKPPLKGSSTTPAEQRPRPCPRMQNDAECRPYPFHNEGAWPRRRWRLLRRPPSRASESPQGISSVSDVAVGASAVEAIRLQSQVSASKAAKSSAEATDLARELINATSRIGAGWQTFSSMSTLVKRADQDAPQMAAAFWCLLEGQRYSAACFALKLIRRASEGSNAQKAIPFFNCLLREGLKALQMEGKSAPDIAPIAESC
mmetsp:Transcript_43456/g.102369  ORF Transcript_43456/g.102369 Transcript_43456/m.102369 type:complete len:210 (-) Transcript_43456:76-705(-)